jgi:hypothetical protein
MRILLRNILLVLIIFLLCACSGLQNPIKSATPTVGILADSFFFGCAYLDSNGNGKTDPDDQGLEEATFVVALNDAGGFVASTPEDGCATIVVPGGLNADSWPVTTRMEPPEETGYELVSPAEVVLEYPESHADFLFTDVQQDE